MALTAKEQENALEALTICMDESRRHGWKGRNDEFEFEPLDWEYVEAAINRPFIYGDDLRGLARTWRSQQRASAQ